MIDQGPLRSLSGVKPCHYSFDSLEPLLALPHNRATRRAIKAAVAKAHADPRGPFATLARDIEAELVKREGVAAGRA